MTSTASIQDLREEALAKILAAQTMGLVKNPTGTNLPQDLWIQKLGRAKEILLNERKHHQELHAQ
jgi:hypothetical protein